MQQGIFTHGREWDMGKEVDLEKGMQLTYEGGGALSAGAYWVIFPCKLRLGEEQGHRVIDAVVKCENKECNDKDGYEIHKVRNIPRHDNLVRFYDGKVLGPGESAHFGALMVFEKMDCNLKQLVFDDPTFAETCTYEGLVQILEQIIQGLMWLNKNGYIHLSLKPKNVLVAKNPGGRILVKITDFGKSKQLNDKGYSVTGIHHGTEPYMAPEVRCAPIFVEHSWKITEHADIFSFGMLICALLNRQGPPFTQKQQYFCGRKILVSDVVPYKVFCEAPLQLCDLIEKCLQFKLSKIEDSRKHGRPSLKETLQALRKMKECKWMTQTLQTQQGERGFFEATWMGFLKMAKNIFLIKKNVNIQDENLSRALLKQAIDGNIRAVKNLLNRGVDVNTVDDYGASALYRACFEGYTEIAKLLVESGADLNLVNKDGESALYQACFKCCAEVAKLLVESGADVNLVNNSGWSALYRACENGRTEVAKLLLESGADVNLVDNSGKSVLYRACWNGRTEVAKLLVESGADVNLVDSSGKSVLYRACFYGHREVAKLLVKLGADVNLVDKDCESALFGACFYGHTEVAKLLVESGADVNLVDNSGWNALNRACWNGHTEIAKLLLESGAHVNFVNKNGEIVLQIANRKGLIQVANLIAKQ